ncbi:unnamed protein product [Dimorphilus gyrociliatus]|uniref:RING-type domain-containing protein n=1 Tax=Dimorphilus gyrociliatus TaxID=2664684 RepID=A0A7I8VE14_9ANNE|nr:unnamed protein product [Dimorphilus gyrociliatus]
MATCSYTAKEDEQACIICFELMITPRILSCKHIFCLDCLRRLRGIVSVKCPLCRQEAIIPGGNVANFPIKFYKIKVKVPLANFLEVKQSCLIPWSFKSYFVTNDGLYSAIEFDSQTIHLAVSFDDPNLWVNLDRKVENFVITESYIYAIDHLTSKILFTKKPFGINAHFRIFNSTKTRYLMATEDEICQCYILSMCKDKDDCLFFYNGTLQWSFPNCKELGCILHNHNPIVKTMEDIYVMIDKSNGTKLRFICCTGYSQIYDLFPYGILISKSTTRKIKKPSYKKSKYFYTEYEKNEISTRNDKHLSQEITMELFSYNYSLLEEKKIDEFHNAMMIGTTTNGLVCIYIFGEGLKIYKLK